MPLMAPDSTRLLGAPPAAGAGFAYSNGEFFADASGGNRHRRATPAQIKAHFAAGSEKDYPAHWFEAQLIHYGLNPSKTKAVARMRLYDAVRAGQLVVPGSIARIEAELRKAWTREDRELKKEQEPSKMGPVKVKVKVEVKVEEEALARSASRARVGVKREGDDDEGMVQKATKKIKGEEPELPARQIRTARWGSSFSSSARARPPSPSPPPRFATGQTSRRSEAPAARGRFQSPPQSLGYTDLPASQRYMDTPALQGCLDTPEIQGCMDEPASSGDMDYLAVEGYLDMPEPQGYLDVPASQSYIFEDDFNAPPPRYSEQTDLERLGLLNGTYAVTSEYVGREWPIYGSNFELTLTLSGSSLWGSFDLGVVHGVLFLEERPRTSSHHEHEFLWRGREAEGPIMYGDSNTGWVKFLGGGRIEGQIGFMSLPFTGQRLPGQGTRSQIDARTMQDEWLEYSESEYERERLARWR